MSDEARWVVRDDSMYLTDVGTWTDTQTRAAKMPKGQAESVCRDWSRLRPVRMRRLISRAEAIARAERKARREALEDAAAMLDRCAQSQDHAAWEAAQAGLSALVAKHETVAGSYRLSAKSIREMVAW